MKAVIAQNQKPVMVDIATPEPKPGEVLIDVKACALNRADLLQVMGNYPVPPDAPDTLGMELAGEVIACGDGVTDFKVGDRVMSLVGGGGYAEIAVAPAAHTMPVPDHLSYEQAAAIPEAYLTAYSNMVEIGGLMATDTLLVHAAASSVGLACLQMATVIGVQKIIATASAAKHAICRENGAHMCVDYKTQNFADAILAEHEGVDLVIDFVGAAYWEDNMRVLNKWGRLVFIGLMGGAVKEVNFGLIMRKRLTITGTTMRDRTFERKAGLIGRFWKWAMPHFKTGALHPVIWKTLSLDDVVEAHRLMAENQNAGKIVLTVR